MPQALLLRANRPEYASCRQRLRDRDPLSVCFWRCPQERDAYIEGGNKRNTFERRLEQRPWKSADSAVHAALDWIKQRLLQFAEDRRSSIAKGLQIRRKLAFG